jgi:hypothetical protein
MEIYHIIFLCYCILISNVIHSYMLYMNNTLLKLIISENIVQIETTETHETIILQSQ